MKSLSYLLPFFSRYRAKLLWGLLCVLGMAVLGLWAPLVVGEAVDSLKLEITRGRLLAYGLLILAISLIQGLFGFGQRRILVAMSRHIEYDLRNDYFRHLEKLPQDFYQRSSTGDLMARATNDLDAIRMVCGPAVMYSANTLLAGVGAGVLMARIHPQLTWVVLCLIPFVAIASREVGIRVYRHFQRVQEQFSTLSTRVQENFSGARVVRAYAQEEAEAERFRVLNWEYVERNRGLIRWSAASRPLLQLLLGLGSLAVLAYGGLLTYLGEMSVGDLVMFNLLLGKLSWPMISLGWVINLVQRGGASMVRLREVLETPPAITEVPPLVHRSSIEGAVSLRGLRIAFGDGPAVLDGIDLEVPAATTVAIVGRTGAGKSTLLALLPRIVDPPPGTVFVDGVDVRHLPLSTLRSSMGVVPQETFLFSATLRENVAFGRPDATDEEILEAVRTAGLDQDLEILPRGLETLIGERGVTLSGGQKQRVALARALLRQPAMLLLDDCLSAVDTHTEERILGNLRRVFEGRTVFLVSHRISTVKDADLILVLDHGRIVEQGTHEDLVAHGGLYSELHRRQQLEEQLASV